MTGFGLRSPSLFRGFSPHAGAGTGYRRVLRPRRDFGQKFRGSAFHGCAFRAFSVDSKSSDSGLNKSNKVSNSSTDIDIEQVKATKRFKRKELVERGKYAVNLENLNEVIPAYTGKYVNFGQNALDLIPEGFGGDIQLDIDWSLQDQVTSMIIRPEYFRIAERMSKIEESSDSTKTEKAIAICGPRGIGKSMVLNLAVLRARQNGWLTMFVHDCQKWVTEKGAHERGTGTLLPIVESKIRPNMFNQPIGSQTTLKFMAKVHSDKLKLIPRRRKYDHKAYDIHGDTSLMSIVDRGLKSKAFAGDAVYDLRMELSLVTEYPVLIAIDEINCLYWPTCFYSKATSVAPSSLLWAESFRPFDIDGGIQEEHRLQRGLIIGATTAKYGWACTPEKIVESSTETGMKFFRPFDVRTGNIEKKPNWLPERKWTPRDKDIEEINVSPFDRDALRSYMVHMKRQDLISNHGLFKDIGMETLLTLSGGIPGIIRQHLLNPLFGHPTYSM